MAHSEGPFQGNKANDCKNLQNKTKINLANNKVVKIPALNDSNGAHKPDANTSALTWIYDVWFSFFLERR